MKYFKKSLLEDIELSYMIRSLDHLIEENNPTLIESDMDMKQLNKKDFNYFMDFIIGI
jgi:hypothetical protein